MLVEPYQPETVKSERDWHHRLAINAYESSFGTRGLTAKYRDTELRRLNEIFTMVEIGDLQYPSIKRPVDTFDLCNPLAGSRLKQAINRDILGHSRIKACLKAVDRFCRFLKEEHTLYAPGHTPIHLPSLYGPIESPINRYSIPRRTCDPSQNRNYLTDAEYKTWLKFSWSRIQTNDSPRELIKRCQLHVMYVLAGELGLRLQELIGLEPQHFDLSAKVCTVMWGKGCNGSGYRKRVVPVSDFAKATLADYLKRFNLKHGEPLFQNHQSQRLSKNTAHHWIDEDIRAIRRAKLPILIDKGFGWHGFRRTYATAFLKHGGHPYDLKRNAGWSFLSTMNHYLGDAKGVTPNPRPPLHVRKSDD